MVRAQGHTTKALPIPRYRPDIDGLRAIAVLAVILFHAGTPGFSGGFLGVDVFFVISGYLITQILTRPGPESRSIVTFYERRIRRIAPALVLVLATVLAVSWVWLSPYELVELSKTGIAATAFASNFYFMRRTGYFTVDQAYNPLLHLWSLGVEEQFYIVYPGVLWVLHRLPTRFLRPVLIAALLVSFALSQWLTLHHAVIAFYFPGSRAWELLLGAVVALAPFNGDIPRSFREIGAGISLACIVVPVSLFSSTTPWPSPYAAIPCLGTAALLVLNDGHPNLIGKVLSTPPLVGIGLISYSLYLWHWPLFVLFGRITLKPIGGLTYALLIAAAFALAWLSWRFVERPFRRKTRGPTRRAVFRLAAASFAALLLFGGLGFASKGMPARYNADVNRIYGYFDADATPALLAPFDGNGCFLQYGTFPFEKCFVLSSSRPNILLWGDSHARNYLIGLRDEAEKSGFNLVRATFAACPPALDNPSATPACAEFNREVFRRIDDRMTAVVISAQVFNKYSAIEPIKNTLQRLTRKGIRVVVIGPSLDYRWPVSFYIARFRITGDNSLLNSRSSLVANFDETERRMREAFSNINGITYISVRDTVCNVSRCPIIAAGVPMQFDSSHTTAEGSLILGRAIWPQVRAALGG